MVNLCLWIHNGVKMTSEEIVDKFRNENKARKWLINSLTIFLMIVVVFDALAVLFMAIKGDFQNEWKTIVICLFNFLAWMIALEIPE